MGLSEDRPLLPIRSENDTAATAVAFAAAAADAPSLRIRRKSATRASEKPAALRRCKNDVVSTRGPKAPRELRSVEEGQARQARASRREEDGRGSRNRGERVDRHQRVNRLRIHLWRPHGVPEN